MSEHRKINDIWKAFEKQTMPHNAGPVQRREAKIAFFAGFYESMVHLQKIAREFNEEDLVKRVLRYHDECRGFFGTL